MRCVAAAWIWRLTVVVVDVRRKEAKRKVVLLGLEPVRVERRMDDGIKFSNKWQYLVRSLDWVTGVGLRRMEHGKISVIIPVHERTQELRHGRGTRMTLEALLC